jgi:reactive intermediate/imine deaminase
MSTRIAGAVLGSCVALAAFDGHAAERAETAASTASHAAAATATQATPAPAAAANPAQAQERAGAQAGPGRTDVHFLNSGRVLPTGLPFSEAVRHGDTVYLSGQIGVVPGTLQLVPGGIDAEARQTMDNVRATLEAHGLSMADLVKCTVMLADMAEWGRFNEIYRGYFVGRYPARSALGASGLALGARVEVECIAAVRP